MQDSSEGCHRLLQSQLVTPVCTRWCVKQTSMFETHMVAARPQLLASDPLSLQVPPQPQAFSPQLCWHYISLIRAGLHDRTGFVLTKATQDRSVGGWMAHVGLLPACGNPR